MGGSALDRVINARNNWNRFWLRSLLETGFWLYITFVVLNASGSLIAASTLGAASGIFMIVIAERSSTWTQKAQSFVIDVMDRAIRVPMIAPLARAMRWILINPPFFIMLTFAFLFWGVSSQMQKSKDIAFVLFLTNASGIAFITCGHLFTLWQPTDLFGRIMKKRVVNTTQNWRKYPLRSALEVSFFVGSILLAYQWTEDATFAVILGLAVGIVTTVCGELMFTELLASLSTQVQATSEHAEGSSAEPVVVEATGQTRRNESTAITTVLNGKDSDKDLERTSGEEKEKKEEEEEEEEEERVGLPLESSESIGLPLDIKPLKQEGFIRNVRDNIIHKARTRLQEGGVVDSGDYFLSHLVLILWFSGIVLYVIFAHLERSLWSLLVFAFAGALLISVSQLALALPFTRAVGAVLQDRVFMGMYRDSKSSGYTDRKPPKVERGDRQYHDSPIAPVNVFNVEVWQKW